MKRKIPGILLVVMVVSILILTGCQPANPATLSNEKVIQTIDNILKSIDAGNFQGFKQDFSDEMKIAFPQEQFTNLADLLHNNSGNYVSCAGSEPELSNNQGFAVYRLACTYELESVMVTITFKVDGDKVEGLFFDSTNLRNISQ